MLSIAIVEKKRDANRKFYRDYYQTWYTKGFFLYWKTCLLYCSWWRILRCSSWQWILYQSRIILKPSINTFHPGKYRCLVAQNKLFQAYCSENHPIRCEKVQFVFDDIKSWLNREEASFSRRTTTTNDAKIEIIAFESHNFHKLPISLELI